jgi:hypothetical protein
VLNCVRPERATQAPDSHSAFAAWRLVRKVSASNRMIELEVYAAGVRDLDKILELDHELQALVGLHYKVDRNHDIVYFEMEEPIVSLREIKAVFTKLGLDPKFVGTVPAGLRPGSKTQLLSA